MPARPRARPVIRYAFDENNRLLISRRSAGQRRARSLELVDGALKIDQRNRLRYVARRTVLFDGDWRLSPNHELALTLRATDEQPRQTLYLNGALVDAAANTLVFTLRQTGQGGLSTAQRLTLSGRWAADAQNRLTFLVDKGDGDEDRLTLQGGWELGPHHEIIYRYRQRGMGSRADNEHALIFDGVWDVTAADRIAYRLSGSSDAAFEFKASLQSRSLMARDGKIVYQLGAGISGGMRQSQRVTLYGAWKLNRDLSVAFEIPYGEGRIQAIRFSGELALTARDRVAVALSTGDRKTLGATVTFTRDVTPDISLFAQARKDGEETVVIGGIRGRF